MKSIKSFVVFGVIFAVAIISGVAIGSIYVSSLSPEINTSAMTEAELRGDQEEIAKLYEDAISGRKTSLDAVELFQIAEYKLKQTPRYVKVLSGRVTSGAFGINVTQDMLTNKIVTEDGVTYLKMSRTGAEGLAPSMAVKVQYFNDDKDNVYIIETRDKDDILGDNFDNYRLNLDDHEPTKWSIEDYKKFFNTTPDTPLTFIVSNITCQQGNYTKDVKKNADGNYEFEIEITDAYAAYAAYYYSYEIRHYSEDPIPTTPPTTGQLPGWTSIKIKAVVDSDFNFVRIDYTENYSVKKGIITAPVTDNFSDVFYYDEETISKYIESI